MAKYTISIAVHNNLELTRRCLESVIQHSSDCGIVVTDNASQLDSLGYLQQFAAQHPRVMLVENHKNKGFGVVHNAALGFAHGEFFVVLNNDVQILQDGWLEAMASKFAENPKLAVCGVTGTCCYLDAGGLGTPVGKGPPDYVEGSCLMVLRSWAMNFGLFSDEFLFAYCEDADLSLRARSRGFEITHVPIKLVHVGAATSRIVKDVDLDGYHLRNQYVLANKWAGYLKTRSFARPRILVRRSGALGDVIMATAAIGALHRRLPEAQITVATFCPEVLARNPDVVATTRLTNLHQGIALTEFDRIIDLDMAYEKRPMKHVVESYLQECGITDVHPDDYDTALYPGLEDLQYAEQVMLGGPWMALHPGMIPGWAGRQWNVGKFSQVVESVRFLGNKIVLVGDNNTPAIASDLDIRGQPFGRVAACISKAVVFFGLDSGPMHIAQAMRIPVVGIFGSVDPKTRLHPFQRAAAVTAENVGCLGCHNYLPGPRTITSQCMRGREICMETLTVQQVLQGVYTVRSDKLDPNR